MPMNLRPSACSSSWIVTALSSVSEIASASGISSSADGKAARVGWRSSPPPERADRPGPVADARDRRGDGQLVVGEREGSADLLAEHLVDGVRRRDLADAGLAHVGHVRGGALVIAEHAHARSERALLDVAIV